MLSFHPRHLQRIAICLTGGLLLAGVSAIGYWAGTVIGPSPGSSSKDARAPRPDQVGDEAGNTSGRSHDGLFDPIVDSGPREDPARQPSTGGEAGPDDGAEPGELAVFSALERLERRMAAGMNRARESVVALEYATNDSPPGSRRLATGVVINSSGDVLSIRIDPPSAAASGATPILARDWSGRRHAVQWVAIDPETGLTLLRIAPGAVRPIVIAPVGPTLGSQVFVVGNPFGLGHSVSRGHVAGLDRALRLGPRQIGGLIQVQAPLYPGDSGAAVTDLRGQLLGLIRSGLANPAAGGDRVERDNDFGFAIGTRDLLWVADHLRARGKVDRAYLGVRLHSAIAPEPSGTGAAGKKTPLPGLEGAWLEEVFSGTPAAKAGLRSGDAIIAIDGEPIHSSPDLNDRLDRLPSQANIRLEVLRGQGPSRKQLRFVLQTTSRPVLEPHGRPSPATSKESRNGAPGPQGQVSTAQERPPTPSQPGPDAREPASTPPINVVPTVASTPLDRSPAPPPASDPIPDQQAPPTSRNPTQDAPSVTIPAPVRSPLRAPIPPTEAEDLKLTLPKLVSDRLNQLERRLEKLERQAVTPTKPQPASGKTP